jgi:hypothetical protein
MRTPRVVSYLLSGLVSACGATTPVVTFPDQTSPPPAVTAAPNQPVQQPSVVTPAKPQGPVITAGPGNFIARFVDKSGAPVAGVEVTIINTKDKKTSGPDGKVVFDNLPANSQFQTIHNDYVQLKESVPFTANGIDIPLVSMADYH